MKNPKCPNCNCIDTKEIKTWKLLGGKGNVKFRVHLYECTYCTKRFRKLERI